MTKGVGVCVGWLGYLITGRTGFAVHIYRNLVVFLIGQIVGHAGEVHRDGEHVVREEAADRATSVFSILEGIVKMMCWLGLGLSQVKV